jgi:hypothetical protein
MDSETTMPLIEKVAISLWAFMRAAGLKVKFGKQDALSFVFQLSDITEDAEGIGLSFLLDLNFMSKYTVEDNEASIEKICYAVTFDLGCQLFKAKCSRLLQHDEKRKIILPNE